jgi:hypothetical protein
MIETRRGLMCILDNGHWFGVGWSWLALLDISLFCLRLVDELCADFGLPCICRKHCEEVGIVFSSIIYVNYLCPVHHDRPSIQIPGTGRGFRS